MSNLYEWVKAIDPEAAKALEKDATIAAETKRQLEAWEKYAPRDVLESLGFPRDIKPNTDVVGEASVKRDMGNGESVMLRLFASTGGYQVRFTTDVTGALTAGFPANTPADSAAEEIAKTYLLVQQESHKKRAKRAREAVTELMQAIESGDGNQQEKLEVELHNYLHRPKGDPARIAATEHLLGAYARIVGALKEDGKIAQYIGAARG